MMRQAIAREAARLMIEHGHEDYGFAKRKAAERFGVIDLAVLPKNTEIEEALAEHQRLFAPDAHASELSAMRNTALEAMRLLAEFEPRLVGPLLSGTATAHNDITLHLFADTPRRSRSSSWTVASGMKSRNGAFACSATRSRHFPPYGSWRAATKWTRRSFRSMASARRHRVPSTAGQCGAQRSRKSKE